MRIDNNVRTGQVSARSAQRPGAGGMFQLDNTAATPRAAPTAAPATASGIEALLALQAVEDPLFARKKALRHGSALLDALTAAQADLLTGEVGEGRLNLMMALVTQARDEIDPALAALIDDIELRVRVELAKHGRYPA